MTDDESDETGEQRWEFDFADDEFDEDEYLAAWDAAAAEACEILRTALSGEVGLEAPADDLEAAAARLREGYALGGFPHSVMAKANGWDIDGVPADDTDVVVWSAGALVIMEEDPGMPADDQATIMTLEFADWLGAVAQLVRAGVGASATAGRLASYIDECPEIEGEIDADDVALVELGFELVLPTWEASGVVDEHGRLTPLGKWVLPRMLATAWGGDFDAGAPREP